MSMQFIVVLFLPGIDSVFFNFKASEKSSGHPSAQLLFNASANEKRWVSGPGY